MLFCTVFLLPCLLGLASTTVSQSVPEEDISNVQNLRAAHFNGSGSSCGCDLLSHLFAAETSYPITLGGNYLNESTHYYDLREDLGPKCVFVPRNSRDVAIGVVALKACNSPFAVRGAGHMPVRKIPISKFLRLQGATGKRSS
jgi:hypothetical protein